MSLLSVNNIDVHYGSIQALHGVSFELNEGEIVTLIGANGAGKSTTLNTISGLIRPSTGAISFQGNDITEVQPPEIVKRGLIQVPEGRKIFGTLTVWENLDLGAFLNPDKKDKERLIEEVFERFPRLKERRNQKGGTLSGGEQQMLAIGRGLMAKPKVLLLDEPSMGLSPILVEQIFDTIREINQRNIHPSGGTKCVDGAFHCRPRLRARYRSRGSGRACGRPAAQPGRDQRLSWWRHWRVDLSYFSPFEKPCCPRLSDRVFRRLQVKTYRSCDHFSTNSAHFGEKMEIPKE